MIDFFALDLPKWPQLMIVGDPVSEDQAKDIIFRTETFLTDPSDIAGGNNRGFNASYLRESGMADLKASGQEDWMYKHTVMEYVRGRIGFVNLEYLHNTWASSSYVYGPYGFCSPGGEIFYDHNIGKYPSVLEVYTDFVRIAQAFPYLKFKASLYSGEHGDEEAQCVVSFVVQSGDVTMTMEDFNLRAYHRPHDIADAVKKMLSGDREQGLPFKWIVEFQRRVKALIPEAIQAVKDQA
jgi:hypothetical protein